MLRGYNSRLSKREATKLLLELDLFDYCDGTSGSLKRSDRRKLSLAIAVMGDVDILLIDSPTIGVGKTEQRKIWSFILKYKNKKTVIIATGDAIEAEVLGERLTVMNRGRLLCYGSPW